MKTNHVRLLSTLLVYAFLSACGTVSTLKSTDETQKAMPDLSTLTAVAVLDSENKTNRSKTKPAATHPADLSTSEIKATGASGADVHRAESNVSLECDRSWGIE